MLQRENAGVVSNSLTAEQFRQAKGKIDMLEMARLEAEVQTCGMREQVDVASEYTCEHTIEKSETNSLYSFVMTSEGEESYDTPYEFALPISTREVLTWARLLTKVWHRVLVP